MRAPGCGLSPPALSSTHFSVTAARQGDPPSGPRHSCLPPGAPLWRVCTMCGVCTEPALGKHGALSLGWNGTCGLLGKDWSFLGHLPASDGAALEQWEVLGGPMFLGIEEHGRRRAGAMGPPLSPS